MNNNFSPFPDPHSHPWGGGGPGPGGPGGPPMPPMVDLATAVQDVHEYIARTRITDWMTIGATTLLLYDILTTLDREIFYVWRSRWSYAKFVFLVNRYLAPLAFVAHLIVAFIDPPSIKFCIVTGYFYGMAVILIMTIGTSVIMARTWAIYERNPYVIFALVGTFIVTFLPSWYIIFNGLANGRLSGPDMRTIANIGWVLANQQENDTTWELRRCYTPRIPPGIDGAILSSLIYESLLFSIMVYKMRQERRERERIIPKNQHRIIDEFYRDGVLYYGCIFAALLSASIGAFMHDDWRAEAYVASQYFVVVKAMMGSRIILRLRSYFSRGSAVVDGGQTKGRDRFPGHGGIESDETDATVSTAIQFAPHVVSGPDDEEAQEGLGLSSTEWTDAPSPRYRAGRYHHGPRRLSGQSIVMVRRALEMPIEAELAKMEDVDVVAENGRPATSREMSPIRRWMHLPEPPPPAPSPTHDV